MKEIISLTLRLICEYYSSLLCIFLTLMASVIKELIKKFKEQIEQVDQWTVAYE